MGRRVGLRRITNVSYGLTVGELLLDRSNVQQQIVDSAHAGIDWRHANRFPWIQ